jgi:AcrR family transcriptional regulator
MSTLADKKLAFTKNLILEAACKLAETSSVSELSFKKVSEKAGMSERTMFRYCNTRDEFLDALTARLLEQLDLPKLPKNVSELDKYLKALYQHIEDHPRNVMVLLSSELLPRVYASSAKKRMQELNLLLNQSYPNRPKALLEQSAANLRYILSAVSWHHYRMHFKFDIKKSIACAKLLVNQTIEHLEKSK